MSWLTDDDNQAERARVFEEERKVEDAARWIASFEDEFDQILDDADEHGLTPASVREIWEIGLARWLPVQEPKTTPGQEGECGL